MNPMRYWLSPLTGAVSTDPHDGWTEVQVVPLDAITLPRTGQVSNRAQAELLVHGRLSILGSVPLEEHHLDAAIRAAGVLVEAVEYLREHPPVDEEQVRALADLISEAVDSGISVNATDGSLERFLVKQGVRVGGESDV